MKENYNTFVTSNYENQGQERLDFYLVDDRRSAPQKKV